MKNRMSFHEITGKDIPANLAGFFDQTLPQAKRCFAVLDGVAAGRVVVDDVDLPTSVIVQEPYDNSIFMSGNLDAANVHKVVSLLREEDSFWLGYKQITPISTSCLRIQITMDMPLSSATG